MQLHCCGYMYLTNTKTFIKTKTITKMLHIIVTKTITNTKKNHQNLP